MKFDYCKEVSLPGSGASSSFPYTYHFQFSLSYNEIEKVLHKYGAQRNIDDIIEYGGKNEPHMIQLSLKLIQDTFTDDGKVDLGIDYKKKYEELVELLKPYKLEDDMSPSTTLKMILKYQVK